MFESNYPLWAGIVICFTVYAFGYFVTRKLPDDIKKLSRQKIGSIGLVPMAFGVFFSYPFVSSYTMIDDTEIVAVDTLNSIEKISDFQKVQSQRLEKLNREVVRLRTDVSNVGDFMRFLLQIVFGLAISWCVSTYISKNRQIDEIILDEKRGEKTLNL
jgi:hypothetical protein